MKTQIYETPVDNAEKRVARVLVFAGKMDICLEYFRIFGIPYVVDVRPAVMSVNET